LWIAGLKDTLAVVDLWKIAISLICLWRSGVCLEVWTIFGEERCKDSVQYVSKHMDGDLRGTLLHWNSDTLFGDLHGNRLLSMMFVGMG